jgi:hypothetical protein
MLLLACWINQKSSRALYIINHHEKKSAKSYSVISIIRSNQQKQKATRYPKLMTHCETLDKGTSAFIKWLTSYEKDSISTNTYDNPIILKRFSKSKYCLLHDNFLGHEVIVETHDGVPRCTSCDKDDCGHLGFTILLEQKYDNDGIILD